jgi:hypothetical protein
MATAVNMTVETGVTFIETNLSAQLVELHNEYVFFTGGIAGISDSPYSEGSPETLNRCPDIVELNRD